MLKGAEVRLDVGAESWWIGLPGELGLGCFSVISIDFLIGY